MTTQEDFPWWVSAIIGAGAGGFVAGIVLIISGNDERVLIAECANADPAYVELAASLEECHQTRWCRVTAQDIRDLRAAKVKAADNCAKETE